MFLLHNIHRFYLHIFIVISAKQFDAANMDVSSLDNEVFPMEEDLVNFTQQVSPAQISIPPQVLLEERSNIGSDGELQECYRILIECANSDWWFSLNIVRTRLTHVSICRKFTTFTCSLPKLGRFPTYCCGWTQVSANWSFLLTILNKKGVQHGMSLITGLDTQNRQEKVMNHWKQINRPATDNNRSHFEFSSCNWPWVNAFSSKWLIRVWSESLAEWVEYNGTMGRVFMPSPLVCTQST